MNFQYLEHLEVEFLSSNFNLKKATLIVEENSTENPVVMKRKLFKKIQAQRD